MAFQEKPTRLRQSALKACDGTHLSQREQPYNALSHFCFRSLQDKQDIEANPDCGLIVVPEPILT